MNSKDLKTHKYAKISKSNVFTFTILFLYSICFRKVRKGQWIMKILSTSKWEERSNLGSLRITNIITSITNLEEVLRTPLHCIRNTKLNSRVFSY